MAFGVFHNMWQIIGNNIQDLIGGKGSSPMPSVQVRRVRSLLKSYSSSAFWLRELELALAEPS